jgi:UDP-2-acetamido-2,6-beta-L-arabino-hexul-4-ose reductase
MKIGITGSEGFIGYHTYTYLKYATDHDAIKLNRDFGKDIRIKECDWVIHLAGMNRGDENEVYETNVRLTSNLLESIVDDTKILFASSHLAEEDNLYGASKRDCEEMLKDADPNHKSIRIPNVFGPFCKPNYNSFVATFCYKLCNDETPEVLVDNTVQLTFVTDVVKALLEQIEEDDIITPLPSKFIKVTEVLEMLKDYKKQYGLNGKIPNLNTNFKRHLFNTFRSYMNYEDRLFPTTTHSDDRGELAELVNVDMSEGLVFTSFTNPTFKRGQHFHIRKFERFCVVGGEAIIRMRKIGDNKIDEYRVSGNEIKVIDMPVFYTHHIENVGRGLLRTVFWISERVNKDDTDTYWEDV